MMMMVDGVTADYTLKSCFLLKSLNLMSFKFCLQNHKTKCTSKHCCIPGFVV